MHHLLMDIHFLNVPIIGQSNLHPTCINVLPYIDKFDPFIQWINMSNKLFHGLKECKICFKSEI